MYNSITLNLTIANFSCISFLIDKITSISRFDFTSTQETNEVTCPFCSSKSHIYDRGFVTLKDMPVLAGIRNNLRIRIHRYRCVFCGASFSEKIPFQYPGTRITSRLAEYIKSLLKYHLSIKDISSITGVHWNTISRIHTQYMEEKLIERADELQRSGYKPKYLAVDEFAIHKGHTYATCVMDLEKGEIIWVGKGRTIKDFEKFFEEVPSEYLGSVKAVAMDMNVSYNKLVSEYLPNADIVYDRYHFQAQYGKEVLGAVRLEEARLHQSRSKDIKATITKDLPKEEQKDLRNKAKAESIQYSMLKKSRWTLLKNSFNLTDDKKDKLDHILAEHQKLAICYAMKEEMARLFEIVDEKESERGWKDWFEAARQSNIEQLAKFAALKEKRLPGLVSHARHAISTGPLEGFNNKIKVAKRIGYGYRNDKHFFTLIKYLSLPHVRCQSPRKM